MFICSCILCAYLILMSVILLVVLLALLRYSDLVHVLHMFNCSMKLLFKNMFKKLQFGKAVLLADLLCWWWRTFRTVNVLMFFLHVRLSVHVYKNVLVMYLRTCTGTVYKDGYFTQPL